GMPGADRQVRNGDFVFRLLDHHAALRPMADEPVEDARSRAHRVSGVKLAASRSRAHREGGIAREEGQLAAARLPAAGDWRAVLPGIVVAGPRDLHVLLDDLRALFPERVGDDAGERFEGEANQ